MFNEYDVILSVRQLSRYVPAYTNGTVLLVHSHPRVAYTVEFVDKNGVSLDVLNVYEEDIENATTPKTTEPNRKFEAHSEAYE